MSLLHTLAQIAEQQGPCDAEQFAALSGVSLKRAQKAIQNAVQRGLLVPAGLSKRGADRTARSLTLYARTDKQPEPPKRAQRKPKPQAPSDTRGTLGHLGRVSSVFDLGAIA